MPTSLRQTVFYVTHYSKRGGSKILKNFGTHKQIYWDLHLHQNLRGKLKFQKWGSVFRQERRFYVSYR